MHEVCDWEWVRAIEVPEGAAVAAVPEGAAVAAAPERAAVAAAPEGAAVAFGAEHGIARPSMCIARH
jgi:hypothetical protein